jgi:hypothetical protein
MYVAPFATVSRRVIAKLGFQLERHALQFHSAK